MVKAEKGTPKDIANRAKAKGLQKLQFYCQPCAKQCRDANGYKCHQTSSAHLRNMQLLLEGDASTAIDDFSKTFEDAFVATLKGRHGVKRVYANNVYQEVIADKQHVHMNATKWTTLSEFVVHLGKSGRCIVDEDERGFFVQYIERDASKLERAEKLAERERKEREEEDRMKRRADRLVREAAEQDGGAAAVAAPTEMKKREEGSVVTLKLGLAGDATKRKPLAMTAIAPKAAASIAEDEVADTADNDDSAVASKPKRSRWDVPFSSSSSSNPAPAASSSLFMPPPPSSRPPATRPGLSNLEAILRSTELQLPPPKTSVVEPTSSLPPLKSKRKSNWVTPGLIVRITSESLIGGKSYFRCKGFVSSVVDKFGGELKIVDVPPSSDGVKMGEVGDVLVLDQADLETTIPKVKGEKIIVVNGEGRGMAGTFVETFKGDDGNKRGKIEVGGWGITAELEDFCHAQ